MSRTVSIVKLLSSVADGVVANVSADLSNNINLTADSMHVVLQGNIRDIVEFLDKAPSYTVPTFPRKREPKSIYQKSNIENPHPTHMVSVIQGTTFRLDVDYIISHDDISRHSLLTKEDLCKLSGTKHISHWEHYLRNVPRFTLEKGTQFYYHPMHVYREFCNVVDRSNHVKNMIDKLNELAHSSTNSIPVPKQMFWCHSPRNPWLVNFRALGGCINLSSRGYGTLFDRVYVDISKEFRELIDVRDVLKRLMELKDTHPNLLALHAHQRNILRRCILEIDDYARRYKILKRYDYDTLDMNFEIINGNIA